MRPPIKSNKQASGTANVIGKQNLFESSSKAMFNNLWVGNLAADVTDSDLRNIFEKHGAVDSVTCYPSRSYAFINMKRPEDAKKAKESLQGVVLRGSALKIDFAKPAKPCKSLWVSGISISTSKEELEEEFSKFGKIEDLKFLRDKNTAYIDYWRLEDASKALKMMHGKKRGGSVIRVDYLRSQPKREHEAKEGQRSWLAPPPPPPPKRQQVMGEGSNVLVISYPPIVHIDEQMLHNAMILFGEIDNIRSFPSRHYSLVEFRSVEEAQLAKDGLQGRLFNDPRISIIMYPPPHPRPSFDPAPNCNWSREPLPKDPTTCDYIWRGIIAKGGTPVCHARCVPIRDWIGYEIPEVVNCSARTGLDMLAKHYRDAIGFDIVFFLPDSEEDFGSYTELVRYLGDRNRAGVAKFDDGTTLFLVPPSDFLSKVLNVCGPERLYGVVLKFPGSSSRDEDSKSPPPQAAAGLGLGLSLTPELIATLASLAKGKFNPEPSNTFSIQQQEEAQANNFPDLTMAQGQFAVPYVPPNYPQQQHPDNSSGQQQQAVADFDVDKNERYQSTLQFATNLLLKIHQQQPNQGSLR